MYGAFYREDLKELSGSGDITLVWGDSSYGLKHIVDKHAKEFNNISENLSEIVQKGELISENGIKTILYENGDKKYRVGLSEGFKGEGNNAWIITAYQVKSPDSDFLPSNRITKSDGTNLHSNDINVIPQTTKEIDEIPDIIEWNGKDISRIPNANF